ncbi:DcaP family trimeric outer membrane transporter [Alteromonas sp. a30]|uniref:DcaP family trimeric outer membrane transporter n=1 Tax=Alteromonas sp. a30 TaxID=2730917 RepID=UPI00227FA50D|nr:DcaP family trimeric outer membrane transporter [Alteromonas sp. a30]MCY7295897.1 porin [Alteromonas sp. a30]
MKKRYKTNLAHLHCSDFSTKKSSLKKSLVALALVAGSQAGVSQATAAPLEDIDVSFSGYIKWDSMFSNYSDGSIASGSIGRDFYIPSLTPVGGADESTQFDSHIRQSRFRFTTNTDLGGGEKIKGVLEFDMMVVPDGNERISNSHQPRIRHAFLQYQNWIIGQTWSTFLDVKTLPDSIDFIGVTDGSIFARQPLIRYTQGPFEIALENPETTVTPFGGGARIVTDDNAVPDLVARYTFKGDWGHFSVAGMVRELAYDDGIVDSSETGYGISLTGKFMLGQDDLRVIFNAGSGLGRYLALNASNGAVLDANNELEAIDSTAYAIAYRHVWNNKSRSTIMFSALDVDNEVALTGLSATESTYSARINYMYSLNKKLEVGAEYGYAKREIESGLEGDMNRFQFMAKYSF